jgi:hypothetical protein
MASSGRGGRQVWQDQTGRFYYYDPRTNEIVYSDGTRVPYTAQPTANIPRTNAGAARQLPANNFSTQPYNQQYTTSPPTRAGQTQGIQNVSRQLRNVSIAASPVPVASGPSHAAGQPIDGADVVRNPLIWGAPPRRFSFRPEIQRGLLDPGNLILVAVVQLSTDNSRIQGARSAWKVLPSWQGTCLHMHLARVQVIDRLSRCS